MFVSAPLRNVRKKKSVKTIAKKARPCDGPALPCPPGHDPPPPAPWSRKDKKAGRERPWKEMRDQPDDVV